MAGDSRLPGVAIPDPDGGGSNARHWAWLREHRLRIQQCSKCGLARNPAAEVCHACYSPDHEWIDLVPEGRIYSWTRVWHAASEELEGHTPYVVVWVEVDHPVRPRFLGNLVGDPHAPVEIGERVVGSFEDLEGGTVLNWTRAD